MKASTALPYQNFWLFPLVIVAPMGLDICIPGMTTIAETLNSSLGMVQWLISGFILCMSLGQLIFGPLVDRFGSQRIFILGCCVYLGSTASVYAVSNMSFLIGLRLLQGIGASATAVSVFASVPKLFTGNTIGKVFSLFNGVISLVPVLAPIIGGSLIVHYGWEASFYFLTVCTVICLGLVRLKPLPSEQNNTEMDVKSIMADYAKVLCHPAFRLGTIASSCGFASQLIFFSSSPIVIINRFGIPIDKFGFYFAINATAITGGSLLVSRLLGKIKEPFILLLGAGSLFIAAAGFSLANWLWGETMVVWGYLIPATIGSFGFALLMGAGASVALSPLKTLAGTASALIAAIQMSFSSLVAWGCVQFWTPDWSTMTKCYLLLSTGILLAVLKYQRSSLVVTRDA